ncbi:hypothetical protein CsSME_00037128 [Camellia sinensis var. sinensis]
MKIGQDLTGINLLPWDRPVWSNGEEEKKSSDDDELEEDLSPEGAVYQKTLRLVECSMFAAVAGEC